MLRIMMPNPPAPVLGTGRVEGQSAVLGGWPPGCTPLPLALSDSVHKWTTRRRQWHYHRASEPGEADSKLPVGSAAPAPPEPGTYAQAAESALPASGPPVAS